MKRTWNKHIHTAGRLLVGGAAVLAVVQAGAGLGHRHQGVVPAHPAALAANQDWGVVADGTPVTPANQDWGVAPAHTGRTVLDANQDWGVVADGTGQTVPAADQTLTSVAPANQDWG
ncbi:hypothetical protein AB0L10_18750 [Streptomyces flaveolus]|uniref:hypothetical protein n=1 Tax=Streptomyces flaveolus TaxID=67297 RepID=UPI00341D4CD5